MNNNSNGNKITLLLILFICQVFINWTYVAWIQYSDEFLTSGWLALVPFFAFIYFMFTVIASVELSHKTKFGLTLAGGVILFGIISDVISYGLVYNSNPLFEWILIPLIAMNFALIIYMICHGPDYKSN